VDLHIPQNESLSSLATPDLKNATITFPQGTVLSPSATNGLQACSEAQIGFVSLEPPRWTTEPATCPGASKVGTVKVATPLLASPLAGSVYLAEQGNNPFGSTFAIYLSVEGSGVHVKLAGEVKTDPVSGRLTTTLRNNPQLPFSDLELTLTGGSRAPLANPTTCGKATTLSDLTPWSTPYTPDATPESSFPVEGCGPTQFSPSFTAGTVNPIAGAFSPLTVTFSRSDRDQDLAGLSVQTPPGLLGMLSKVPLCPEPQATLGKCSSASQIGVATVAAGPGSTPVWLPAAGQPANAVYLTGPYKGAPFGLSVVVPAVAGPFNLGTVVVRAAIHVNPRTAQIQVTSDPLPQILDGVPLQVKTVNVLINRPRFTFNPTNCAQQTISGTATSAQSTGATVSNPFAVGACAALAFHPTFQAKTQGRASANGNGASLTVNVTQKTGQANIRKVDVQLPKLLPARLKTLQKACTGKTFDANPATCPAASDVGTARAVTPVLNVPLAGPAFLVSHGGAKFPELVVVLQGQGVTVELNGETDIRGAVTYSRFETVPDAPISSLELKLPEGPHSALATPAGSLCGKTLNMPTTITGQNGDVVKQATKIKITGCPDKTQRVQSRKAGKATKS